MEKEEELKQKVLGKVNKEYQEFLKVLKQCTPEKIIDMAYEKVTKEEMLYAIERKDLSVTDSKALLKNTNTLQECYDEWLKSDGNFNEMLEYAVDKRIDFITEDYNREKREKSKESR